MTYLSLSIEIKKWKKLKKYKKEKRKEKRDLRGRTLCCWYRRSAKRWGQSWRFFRYRTGPERWHLGPGESEPPRAVESLRASRSRTGRCRGASRLWFPSLRSSLIPGPPSRSRTPEGDSYRVQNLSEENKIKRKRWEFLRKLIWTL